MKTFSRYDLNGLKQLVALKEHFNIAAGPVYLSNSKKTVEYFNNEVFFTQLFCQYNFANTDYSFIQSERKKFPSFAEWLKQINTDTILQCFTYIIWTNSFVPGYFQKKIIDATIYQLLSRLEELLVNEDPVIKNLMPENNLVQTMSM